MFPFCVLRRTVSVYVISFSFLLNKSILMSYQKARHIFGKRSTFIFIVVWNAYTAIRVYLYFTHLNTEIILRILKFVHLKLMPETFKILLHVGNVFCLLLSSLQRVFEVNAVEIVIMVTSFSYASSNRLRNIFSLYRITTKLWCLR